MTLKISTHIIDKIKILYVFLTSAVPSPNKYQLQSSATGNMLADSDSHLGYCEHWGKREVNGLCGRILEAHNTS